MSKKKWIVLTGMALVMFVVVSGYLAIAAEYGSQEDPLVSLSYITDVLSPETLQTFQKTADAKAAEIEDSINARMNEYSSELDKKIEEFEKKYADSVLSDDFVNKVADALAEKNGSSAASELTPSWTVVRADENDKIMFSIGTEFVLRFGSAKCSIAGDNGIINITAGTNASDGDDVLLNNQYLVSIASGRGVVATSGITILVNGSYTIEK